MSPLSARRELAEAVWRTWGWRGIVRRGTYEASKRSGALRRSERAWPSACPSGARLLHLGIGSSPEIVPGDVSAPPDVAIRLYGSLDVATTLPPDWHRRPGSGSMLDAAAHWSELSDRAADGGDIKDVWELSRLGWLQPMLRRWKWSGADADAEAVWEIIEDWYRNNPPYLGPNWMCGQESSLRTIAVMFAADALDSSATTTDWRRTLVAQMVQDAVGRVGPTLGYALSQRNNHASSEAGFLWTASVLAPWLPQAAKLRRRSAAALREVVSDQFAPDGSYAQHSPTYQRVAMHVLLWCLAVERAIGEAAPDGVADAVGRSLAHLGSVMVPGSHGQMPNLGGNDGAQVFSLSGCSLGDFRPVLVHASAATGIALDIAPGPWDEEARWFSLSPREATGRCTSVPSIATHAVTAPSAHAVLRAGPFGHRPAHADQLHVDVWLVGSPVAVDAGSYRYSAPPPWGNALAGDDVHNVPRRRGAPQAELAGRFFWRRWSEAQIIARATSVAGQAISGELTLPDGTVLNRCVIVAEGLVAVVDQASAPVEVRWNLVGNVVVETGEHSTELSGPDWIATIVHGGQAHVPTPDRDEPASGWHALTYAQLEPLQALEVDSDASGTVVSVFAVAGRAARLAAAVAAAADLDVASARSDQLERLVSVLGGHQGPEEVGHR